MSRLPVVPVIVLLTTLAWPLCAQEKPAGQPTKPAGAQERGAGETVPTFVLLSPRDTAGALRFTRSTGQLQLLLRFVLESGKVGQAGLRAEVTPLLGPEGVMVVPTLTLNGKPAGQAQAVPEQTSIDVELAASLPRPGVYLTTLSLLHDGRRDNTSIAVTRTAPPLPVQLKGLTTARSVTDLFANPRFWATVVDSADAASWVPVSLSALTRRIGDTVSVQARFDRVVIRDAQDAPRDSVRLGTGQPQRLSFEIAGLNDPGAYTGTLRIGSAGGIEQSFTLLVRWPVWVAALFIFLGVLLSWAIRKYRKKTRPRLENLTKLARWQQEIDRLRQQQPPPGAADQATLATLAARLRRTERDLRLDLGGDVTALLAEVEQKLDLFPHVVELDRAILALPADTRKPLQAKLDLVRAYIAGKAPTKDDTNAALKLLGEIRAGVAEARKAVIEASIAALEQQVASAPGARSGRLDDALREARSGIAAARTLAEEGKLVDAVEALGQARLAFAHALADDLSHALQARPPAGLAAADWTRINTEVGRLLDDVGRQTDPDTAVSAYQAAYACYLTRVAEALQAHARRLAAAGYETVAKGLQSITDGFDDVKAKVTASELGQAEAALASALELLAGAIQVDRARGGQLDRDAAPLATAALVGQIAGGPALPAAALMPLMEPPEGSPPEAFYWAMWWRDQLFDLAVLAIAVLLGLKLLWAGNATWGGFSDCLVAVLWGLGLHQFSAYTGVESLSTELTK